MNEYFEPKQVKVLLDHLEHIQTLMINVATGGQPIREVDETYKRLYIQIDAEIELLQQIGIHALNPNYFRSLWDWYAYWKNHLDSYQSRREYIGQLYSGLTYALGGAWQKYLELNPAIDTFVQDLKRKILQANISVASSEIPITVQVSLRKFQKDHPDPTRTAFIMMKFGRTTAHDAIVGAIRDTLAPLGIVGVRADDKEYNDDLFPNILTYIYGSAFGIAVFERIEADDFNPNVSLEVGYMLALGRDVCLLKDKTLKTLQTDLMGKMYRTFDPLDPQTTIPDGVIKWLRDKNLI